MFDERPKRRTRIAPRSRLVSDREDTRFPLKISPKWSGKLEDAREGTIGATVWPTPSGDRALLLVTAVYGGTAYHDTAARWGQLPAPASTPPSKP